MQAEHVHPPKARLALRVGVSGHRPNKLIGKQDAVDASLRIACAAFESALSDIENEARTRGLYLDQHALVRVISPLAEGADRMVAQLGVERGFDLQVVLPFPADVYERDFASEPSTSEFRHLLASATAVLALDGDSQTEETRNRAYRDCGMTMLRQSDVLVAIWDGKPSEGSAGTGAIVAEALASNIPVVWINTHEPASEPCFLEQITGQEPHHTSPLDSAGARLRALFLPPDDHSRSSNTKQHQTTRLSWTEYFLETWPRWNLLRPVYSLFMGLFAWEWIRPSIMMPTLDQRLAAGKDRRPSDRERTHYAWADQLADYYAGAHRGSFVLGFTLAPLAVLFALLAFGLGDVWPWVSHQEMLWTFGELALIVVILVLVYRAHSRKWHERWIEYRFLAEQLRQMTMLAPLGRLPRAAQFPAHHDHANPNASMASWHFRAIVRESGLVNGVLDEAYRQRLAAEVVLPLIRKQAAYHRKTADRCARVAHMLHRTHIILFVLTFIAVAAHLIHEVCHCLPSPFQPSLLIMLAAVLPAFGASFTARSSQGEFHRIAQRSEAISGRLEKIMEQFLKESTPSAAAFDDCVEEAANLMLEEVMDWRVLFLARPPELPA
jgi:hypothetical protein